MVIQPPAMPLDELLNVFVLGLHSQKAGGCMQRALLA
jgi:hypothetical protein